MTGSQSCPCCLTRQSCAFAGQGAQTAIHHIQQRKPNISGLVLIYPPGEAEKDQETLEKAKQLDAKRLRLFILEKKIDQNALLSVENWMNDVGLGS